MQAITGAPQPTEEWLRALQVRQTELENQNAALRQTQTELEGLLAKRTAELETLRTTANKTSQLLREAVDSIAQGFTIYDENDRLVICNETYRRFYETSRDLIVEGASFEEIIRRGAERGQYAEALGNIDAWVEQRLKTHQAAHGEVLEQQLYDGRWLMVVEHRTASGYIVGNRIDITHLKNIAAALRQNVARTAKIIESAPESMLVVNQDGRIMQLNAHTETLFGYGRGELIGQPVEILIPENLRADHRQQHRPSYARNPLTRPMGSRQNLHARHKSGNLLPVEISLAPIVSGQDKEVIVVIRDVTERRQAAALLTNQNAQLDAILQLSPDGIVSFDRAGVIKRVNSAFIRMTGLSEAQIHDLSQQELEAHLRACAENPAQWPGLDPCFAKVGAGGTAPGGSERQLLALRSPRESVIELLGVNSETSSVSRLLYLHDVTHEVEVDRLKSEFLSHAAHELRTPMASIFGFTELLISQEFDAETRKDLLQTIHKQTAWLIDIINELLDISRIEARRGKDFRIESVSVAPLVNEVLATMQINPARWPVTVDFPPDLPRVDADAAKLRQALTNVLGNAVKYSPNGGAIDIRCSTRTSAEKPFFGITITDHGIGMTPHQAARVGERFFRVDTSGNIPGTGLGMAIAREVITLMGGSVEVASTLNVGTSVTFWLPASNTAQTAAT
jgi:PAS domain S-box-containing protein